MSFNLKNWKRHLPSIFYGLIAFLVIGFIVRVALWENYYYGSKEGSERAAAQEFIPEDIDETEVTTEQRAAYTVRADRPRYLSIPALNIRNARILAVGLTNDGALATPSNIYDTGWYSSSAKPGTGGNLVIDGHNGGPSAAGVFKKLPDLAVGENITIERGDGTMFIYEVVSNVAAPTDQSQSQMTAALSKLHDNRETLTLITCSGTWSNKRATYLSRQFVTAVLADEF